MIINMEKKDITLYKRLTKKGSEGKYVREVFLMDVRSPEDA